MSSFGLQPTNSQVRIITGILRAAPKQALAQGVGEKLGLIRFINALQQPGKVLVINTHYGSQRVYFCNVFYLYLRRINGSLLLFQIKLFSYCVICVSFVFTGMIFEEKIWLSLSCHHFNIKPK